MRAHAVSVCREGMCALLTVGVLSCGGADVPNKVRPNFAVSPYSVPTWHPAGQYLAVVHRPLRQITYEQSQNFYKYEWCEPTSKPWRVNADGSGEKALSDSYIDYPAWSPGGDSLAFLYQGDVWFAPASADSLRMQEGRQITVGGTSSGPRWSPAGHLIAYSLNTAPNTGIWVVSTDGGAPRKAGSVLGQAPDWSPTGDRFVFYGQVGTEWGIGVCDTSGTNALMLYSKAGGYFNCPRWSPDGLKIAFAAKPTNTGTLNIWLMNADGGGAHSITEEALPDFCWSPDGKEIAYVRFSPLEHTLVNGTLWAINVESGAKRQLTFNPGCSP